MWHDRDSESLNATAEAPVVPIEDPLWYDRVEPREAPNVYELILLGIFSIGVSIYDGLKTLFSVLKSGTVMTFRDTES